MKKELLLLFITVSCMQGALAMEQSNDLMPRSCSVCAFTEPEVSFSPLACGHQSSCRMCLQDQIESALMNSGSIIQMHARLRCPNCPREINEADMRAIGINERLIARYNDLQIQEFLNIDHRHRRCPTEGCRETYSYGSQSIVEFIYYSFLGLPNIQCPSCNNIYCPDCQIQHSRFTSCQRSIVRLNNGARLNNNANNNNANEENYINQLAQNIDNKIHQLLGMNVKPCPACKIPIEKNDGCRHMTHDLQMGGCGHEFCWNCLKPWDKHGWNDGRRLDKFFCNPADLAQVGAHNVALWQQFVSHFSSLEDRRLIRYVRNRHVAAALIAVSVLVGCAFKAYKEVKR